MKTKITTLLICTLLLVARQSTAQNLVFENFDTTAGFDFPYHGWTSNIVSSPSCCLGRGADYDWQINITGSGGYYSTGSTVFYPDPPAHSGTGVATLNTMEVEGSGTIPLTSPPETDLVSPSFTIPSSGTTIVSYWVYLASPYYSFSSYYRLDSLSVYVSSGTSVTSSSTLLHKIGVDSSSSISNGWYHYTDTIPSSITGTNYVIFAGTNSGYDYGADINLDDISIDVYNPCSGDPGTPALKAPATVCSGKSFTMTDTALNHLTGMTFQWQKKLPGASTWTTISGATSATYQTNITTATQYRVLATCTASTSTDSSLVSEVDLSPFYICYCNTNLEYFPSYSPPPTIDSVSIVGTSLHNATHAALPAPNFWAQYPDTLNTTANLRQGGIYTLSVNYAGSIGYGEAWADWNQNGTFDGSATLNEYYSLNDPGGSGASKGTVKVTVPPTANTGLTGLRIRVSSNSSNMSSSSACSEFYSGSETEDYIVNIIPAAGHDLATTTILYPADDTTACANSSISVLAIIYNQGSNADSNFYVYATYSGPTSGTIYADHKAVIAPFSYDTVYLGIIAPPLGGKYTLKAYTTLASDSNQSNDTATSRLIINSLPPLATVISDTVCSGNAAVIYINQVANVTHNWYSADTGGSSIYTGDSLAIPTLTSDTVFYIAAVANSTHCMAAQRVPVDAVVGPAPIINLGPARTVCASPSLSLDAGNPGARYLWNTGDTTEAIAITSSGTYSVTVSKYCTSTDSVALTVKPLPYANGISYDKAGTTYTFNAAGVINTDSYLWLFGDSASSTLASPTHTYATAGEYKIKLVLTNTCGTDTITLGVPLSVGDPLAGNPIKIYPNPANTVITISADNNLEIKDAVIINSIGEVVYRGTNSVYKTQTIDISKLPAGNYILRVNSSDGYYTRLFEVVHN